ncbi:uncharacterized protein BDR25DRAFT_394477 [Lindgomyces ingoldianus]|uniref:Uncharacterized protein n=1 Tax=Lindgomyces ingoldianus TaxID=673940 RepID=A0ACB6QSI3_9PLEO|nr:uncharacterized protein BDR25DRAFT_394477 [Lindgomyces ingoldianus]KAF2469070.1 hypothetical protein BDR25DRAFT_394477 [Lindgomyces ingoldianus]
MLFPSQIAGVEGRERVGEVAEPYQKWSRGPSPGASEAVEGEYELTPIVLRWRGRVEGVGGRLQETQGKREHQRELYDKEGPVEAHDMRVWGRCWWAMLRAARPGPALPSSQQMRSNHITTFCSATANQRVTPRSFPSLWHPDEFPHGAATAMAATFDLVLLSSPPLVSGGLAATNMTPPKHQRRAKMAAYSPTALSPLGSPKKVSVGALKSGPGTTTVPGGAAKGFATAASLVKSHHFNLQPDDEFTEARRAYSRRNSLQVLEKVDSSPQKQAKQSTTTTAAGDGAKPKPKKPRARKTQAGKDGSTHNARTRDALTTSAYFADPPPTSHLESLPSHLQPLAPKAKTTKSRKPRAKSEKLGDDETLAKPKKPRAKKTRKVGASSEKLPHCDTGTESRSPIAHPEDSSIWDVPSTPRSSKAATQKQRPPNVENPGLDLEEAIRRRRDWTPAEDTGAPQDFTDIAMKENNPLIMNTRTDHFTDLLSSFTYAHTELQPATKSKPLPSEVLKATKKRRVELVDVPANQSSSRLTSPEKGKAPKKKPRTITDLVIGQYAQKEPTAGPAVTSEFFEPRATTKKIPLNDTLARHSSANPARKRSSSKSASEKGESRSKKVSAKTAAKPKIVADKLLSPTSAVLRVNKQDILFGTSSQLARQESPSFIREIQQAIRESEQHVDILPGVALGNKSSTLSLGPRLGKIQGRQGLWAASARDEEGQLLERQNDVYILEPDHRQALPLPMDNTVDDPDTSFADIDNFKPPPAATAISSDLPTPPSDSNPREKIKDSLEEDTHDLLFHDIDKYTMEAPPSNQQTNSSFLDIDDFLPSTQSIPPLRSPGPLPTPATSTGSPKKRRGRPPKSQSAPPQQRPTPPKKSPSKKWKSATHPPDTPPRVTKRFANIEEIKDSEDDEALSPTPPRVRKLVNSPPLELQPSQSKLNTTISPVPVFKAPRLLLKWDHVRTNLFQNITQTVQGLPPSTNPNHPTWHEKILLYDPIILEDFTAFLNTQTPIRVYHKASQKQLREWKAVLKARGERIETRGGLNSFGGCDMGEMVDDDGEEFGLEIVPVVEKEVEDWMVQKWCEELSICSLLKMVIGGSERMEKGSPSACLTLSTLGNSSGTEPNLIFYMICLAAAEATREFRAITCNPFTAFQSPEPDPTFYHFHSISALVANMAFTQVRKFLTPRLAYHPTWPAGEVPSLVHIPPPLSSKDFRRRLQFQLRQLTGIYHSNCLTLAAFPTGSSKQT